ncbi:MAG: NADH-quinone oxidoreductase subunit A [Acidobacteriota bacterium]|nr:MAG: NADH-quinone oxidoreductase subunit A [Acidobacteriota bacterium]
MLKHYLPVAIVAVIATGAAAGMLILSWFLGPKRMTAEKAFPYESGMPLLDEQRKRHSVRFYLVAALFILFDIEVAFLFPWSLVFRDLGVGGFVEMLVFIGLLLAGFVYVWRRGALEWQ